MSLRKYYFIINPIAGTRPFDEVKDAVNKLALDNGIDYCMDTDHIKDTHKFRENLLTQGFTDLVICGGDGTVNLGVQTIANTEINLGILPVGSGNGLSRSAGISMDINKAFRQLIKGSAKRVDVMDVNGKLSCMLTGIGLDAEVAHRFSNSGTRGLMTYVKKSIQAFIDSESYPFTIRLRDHSFDTDAYFISIANANQFGNNVTIAPMAHINDGLFDVVIAASSQKPLLPIDMLLQLNGFNKPLPETEAMHKNGFLYFQTSSLLIENHRAAPMHIDGDPVGSADHIEVNIIPGAYKLLHS